VKQIATAPISRPSAFSLLADFDEHWRFAGDFVDVLGLYGPPGARTGALLRLRGPFGLRRTVRTRLVHVHAPATLVGRATAGRGTSARIAWALTASPLGITVELTVTDLRARGLDRALLRLGGRRWLRGQLAGTVQRFSAAAAERPHQHRRAA
jgi:hypothetical protein